MYIADSECVIWIHMMILSVKVIEWFFPCGSYYDQRLRQTWWPSRGINVNWAGINIKYTSTVVNREAQECSVAATDGSLAVSICLIAAPGIKIQVHDILRLCYWKVSLYTLFMKIFIIYEYNVHYKKIFRLELPMKE